MPTWNDELKNATRTRFCVAFFISLLFKIRVCKGGDSADVEQALASNRFFALEQIFSLSLARCVTIYGRGLKMLAKHAMIWITQNGGRHRYADSDCRGRSEIAQKPCAYI